MRKTISLLIAFTGGLLAGCSNAPIAGTMDTIFPSKLSRRPNRPLRDNLDIDRDPLPTPDLNFRERERDRERDDSLPAPSRVGGLRSQPRSEPEQPLRGDPFRARTADPGEALPPPLPVPGLLDPIGPGRN
jgi:hypothetical protein